MRVQIALDAARGLEYIHEHTKAHYVHRDIKTSNILLDGTFRGKVLVYFTDLVCAVYVYIWCMKFYNFFFFVFQISDFGLAKLVGKTGEGEATVTKVVGTYGYLAPE